MVLGEGTVAGLRIGDAMVLELAPGGRIHRIRLHLRPWLVLTFLALELGAKLARHPGVVWRALCGGS